MSDEITSCVGSSINYTGTFLDVRLDNECNIQNFVSCKIENFIRKNKIGPTFNNFAQNIDYGYTLEPHNLCFEQKNEKLVYPCISQF